MKSVIKKGHLKATIYECMDNAKGKPFFQAVWPSDRGRKRKNFTSKEAAEKWLKRTMDQLPYFTTIGKAGREFTSSARVIKADAPTSIYLVRGNGLVKIGVARSISARLSSLRTSSPVELTLLFSEEASTSFHASNCELILHELFQDKHVRGEWFSLSEEDVAIAQKKILEILRQAEK